MRIAPGISLGYRRNATAGTWVVRVASGDGNAWTKRVGMADDLDESDAETILTFWEAQAQAKTVARGDHEGSTRKAPLTVARAAAPPRCLRHPNWCSLTVSSNSSFSATSSS